jgi:hypothetical protein
MSEEFRVTVIENCWIVTGDGPVCGVPLSALSMLGRTLPKGALLDTDLCRLWQAVVVAGLPADLQQLRAHPETMTRKARLLEMVPSHIREDARLWVVDGRVGLSSAAIFLKLTGYNPLPMSSYNELTSHPRDPDDFKRCEGLLEAVPSFRSMLWRMADVSPEWAGLVKGWDKICHLLDDEVPGWRKNDCGGAPKACSLIRECAAVQGSVSRSGEGE